DDDQGGGSQRTQKNFDGSGPQGEGPKQFNQGGGQSQRAQGNQGGGGGGGGGDKEKDKCQKNPNHPSCQN
ncbi:MAG TPA: hypothetical protein VFQ31_03795, partial [Methyloceanibacter sp.]|nr:hypothetical protein [Methyloceanibacter sp.]